jgi:arsenate reductase
MHTNLKFVKPKRRLKMKDRKRVLFVCTHNSARSQMAEGLLANIYPEKFEAYSAGTVATKVNPFAIKAMAEK